MSWVWDVYGESVVDLCGVWGDEVEFVIDMLWEICVVYDRYDLQ